VTASELRPASRLRLQAAVAARQFHAAPLRLQSEKPKAEDATEEAKPEEDPNKEAEQNKQDGSTEGEDAKQSKKKEDMPPPPPHGDMTPWEVFKQTFQKEMKESKEWNESTRAIAGQVQTFTESESLRRAKEAYEKTSGTVSDAASTVVKTTAGAIGKGAAWTWDTAPVKGVRKAANVTGEVLDKATKPIRETDAYKNVKDVIDDGSSSRYGGWLEKEERRKRREMLQKQMGLGDKPEDMQEDPK
jgi:mitochondrial import inner membrane translocase subunit TIM44